MASVLLDVFIGLVSNFIYDLVKNTSNCCSFRQLCNNNIKTTIKGSLETSDLPEHIIKNFPQITDFLTNPAVTDLFFNYCSYKLSGSLKQLEDNEKNKKAIYCHEDISHKLVEKFKEFYEVDAPLAAYNELLSFFLLIIEMIFENIEKNLQVGQDSEVVLINNRLDNGFMFIVNKLDSFRERFEQSLSAKIEKRIGEYEKTRIAYNSVLKENSSRAFIYLSDEFSFDQFYIPPVIQQATKDFSTTCFSMDPEEEDKTNYLNESWKSVFFANNFTYIVGKAGYGKSLLLKKIANSYDQLNIMNANEHLVILCDLKTFFTQNSNKPKSLIEFLQESMVSKTLIDKNVVTNDFIEYYLRLGRCLILLDALDEVPKSKRDILHGQLLTYFKSYSPNNKICITTRDRGFVARRNIDLLYIQPLSRQDVEKYLDKMVTIKLFKNDQRENFLRQATSLIHSKFLDNFLVLSLLVRIYKSEQKLPTNKIELYKKCFDYIFRIREQEKLEDSGFYNWERLSSIMKETTFISLSTLSAPNNHNVKESDIYKLLIKQTSKKYPSITETEVAIDEFLKFCSERTELFVPADSDNAYRFFHRSFFEYFYARYLNQQENMTQISTLLDAFDLDSEIFELFIALLKEENEMKFQRVIEFYFKRAQGIASSPELNSNYLSMLTLMMQVVDDYQYIHDYFELVNSYHSYGKTSENGFNKLSLYTSQWIEKEIRNNSNSRDLFIRIYKEEITVVILLTFYHIKRFKARNDKIKSYDSSNLDIPIIQAYFSVISQRNMFTADYFIHAAFNLGLVSEIMDTVTANSLLTVDMSKYQNLKIKSAHLSKGLKYYTSLNIEERNKMIASLSFYVNIR